MHGGVVLAWLLSCSVADAVPAPTRAPAPLPLPPRVRPPSKAPLPRAATSQPGRAPIRPQAAREQPSSRPAPASPLADPLAELERFEARAFPRPGDPRRVPPPRVPETDGALTEPPVPLRTPDAGGGAAAKSLPRRERWLAALTLPDLPVRWDRKVLSYLRFYRHHRQGRAIMGAWLRRMGRYRRTITRELQRQKLPRALIYVAMIESGFDPSRTSRVGAGGLWQFMPRTGRGYGLARDYWVDERRDPQRATVAALRYLKDLYARFNSWELTLAAYNAGFGSVLHAVQKYNTNDYWQLCRYEAGLPWSTSLYVPKIVAAAIVAENRASFGFDKVAEDPERTFELVAVPHSLTLQQLAAAAAVDLATLRELNPELRRGRTPPRQKAWVRVPVGTAVRFYAGLARLGALRYRPYRLRLGDTGDEIAARHGIATRTLRRINGVQSAAELRPGVVILVPAGGSAPQRVAAGASREPILVAVPRGTPRHVAGRRRVFYRVTLGDTLEEIGRHLGVTAGELTRWNALDPKAKLISRMILQAFVASGRDLAQVRLLDERRVHVVVAGSSAFLNTHERRKGRRRLTYEVRRGDTLTRIARRFGLSVGSLRRINSFGPGKRLQAGQTVVIYAKGSKALRRRPARAKGHARRLAKLKPATKKPATKKPAQKKLAKAPAKKKPAKAPAKKKPAKIPAKRKPTKKASD